MRTLDELTVTPADDHVLIHAKARSFLHHQVRNMAGSLKRVGEGAWPESRIRDVLEARSRAAAGPTAPPEGLYLVAIGYPETLAFS